MFLQKLRTRRTRVQRRKAQRLLAEYRVEPGHVAIDCGANVGEITARLAVAGGTVYAFEPNPRMFARLAQRFADQPNVKCFQQAVLDEPGQMKLYLEREQADDPDHISLSSTLYASKVNISRDDYETVEVVDIAEVTRSIEGPIDLLKLDVEGAECRVLNRLIDTGEVKRIRHVIVEMHERGKIPELDAELQALRKRVRRERLHHVNLDLP